MEHIGIDEAGRGCLAGPVVAAAVLFAPDCDYSGDLVELADSKQLGAKKRRRLATVVMEQARAYGVGISWQDEVDGVNVLNATFRAMSRAVLALAVKLGDAPLPDLLIDGNKIIPERQWRISGEGVPLSSPGWEQYLPMPVTRFPAHLPELPGQRAIVDGDALVPVISAASILAKTIRDGIMERLDETYPGYGMAKHKGYGTREHLAAIRAKGPCPLHRKTFRGVLPEQTQERLPGM